MFFLRLDIRRSINSMSNKNKTASLCFLAIYIAQIAKGGIKMAKILEATKNIISKIVIKSKTVIEGLSKKILRHEGGHVISVSVEEVCSTGNDNDSR